MTAAYVDRLLAAADGGPQLAPITDTDPHFGVERAYETLAALHAHRVGQGWRPVGRKIGFTNRTIWPRYGVYRPMWSYVWDRTVAHAPDGVASVDVAGLHEPRIEPEVVFGLGSPLPAEGGSRDVLNAVAWVAAGFEIVHSVFPGWKFRAPDCTAAFGLHARLVVGPRWPIGEDERDALAALLPAFSLTLRRNGSVVETGVGANVLDSPANALVHLREVLASQPLFPPLAAGEIVTTGTVTDAWPVSKGETWTSDFGTLPVRGLTLTIAAAQQGRTLPVSDRTAPFSYRATANGEVAIRRDGRVVTILRGARASEFLGRVATASPDEQQLAMARATGNYRRGNERTASVHPRNRD